MNDSITLQLTISLKKLIKKIHEENTKKIKMRRFLNQFKHL